MPTPTLQLLSRTIYTTDGVTTTWDFSFSDGYINANHVKAKTVDTDGIEDELSFTLVGPYQISIFPALSPGRVLHIYRDTPKTAPLVSFSDGSSLSEVALDTNARQAIMVAAEAADANVGSLTVSAFQAASAASASAALSAASALSSQSSAELAALSPVVAPTEIADVKLLLDDSDVFPIVSSNTLKKFSWSSFRSWANGVFASITTLASSIGSSYIGHLQSGAGAVFRTLQSKLRESVSVKDFGAVGDGVTNDRAAIQAAFNHGKSVYFPSGTYNVGDFLASGERAIDLSGLGNGISIVTDKSVEFVGRTQTGGIPIFFYLKNNSHFYCGPIRFRDTNYNPADTWSGAAGFVLDCDIASSWGDVTFDAIYAKTMVAAMQVYGGDSTHRIRGIKIGQLFSDDCYYGFNAANQGDGVCIDNLIAYRNYRPYFVYGVTDHKVKVFNRDSRSTSGAINISRSSGGLDTKAIDVTYTARDMSSSITHVLVNHIDLLGGVINDVRIHLDIESSVIYTPVRFVNYTGSGGSETSVASSNVVGDIYLSGACDAQANPISAMAAYSSKGILNFKTGLFFQLSQSVLDLFYLDSATRNQSIVWAASVTNPSIGNGTMINNTDLVDGVLHSHVALTIGSTTNIGSGIYSFGLAYTAKSTAIGSAWLFDNSTAYYVGISKIESGSSTVEVFINNSVTAISSTAPIVWATGDRLVFSIYYPIA